MTMNSRSTRRSFIQSAGAALSAPVAVAATTLSVTAAASSDDSLEARLARLEDLQAIRLLNRRYANHVNAGDRAALATLFRDSSQTDLDPEIVGIAADSFDAHAIEVSADRQTAGARLPCIVHVETPIGPNCPLVEMARQQGGGVVRRAESGLLVNEYVRQEGIWKIERSVYVGGS